MKYIQVALKNGAVLRYVKNKINKITATEILFNCGSRCDTIPGIAHFTEHMFFTGTKTLTKEEVTKKYFDFIGTNAHTSYKNISFTGKVLTKEFSDYVSTVEMLINETNFNQQAVDKEIKVVQQEIAMYKDKYRMKANDFHNYNMYGMDTFKNSILGSFESVGSIKSKDVKDYVKKYFVAENCEIYVSSPLSLNKVKSILEKQLVDKLPSNTKHKELPLFLEPKPYEFFYKVKNDTIDKCYLYVTFKMNANYYNIDFKQKFGIVTKMMNDMSEGLMKEMRIKKSLVYGCRFVSYYSKTSSDVTFETECDKENVNEIIKTLAEYLNEIKASGFSKQLLKKTKRIFDYDEDSEEPRLGSHLNRLYQFKYYGKVYKKKYFKQIALSTTLEECNNLFHQVFDNAKICVSVYGSAKKSDLMKESELKKLFK